MKIVLYGLSLLIWPRIIFFFLVASEAPNTFSEKLAAMLRSPNSVLYSKLGYTNPQSLSCRSAMACYSMPFSPLRALPCFVADYLGPLSASPVEYGVDP